MKVAELRNLLKDKEPKRVNESLVEIYKLLKKDKKEEADQILQAVLSGEKKKKQTEQIDIPSLLQEIDHFIDDAYRGYYFVPNRVIPKSERPKWRFKVKNYIKVLLKTTSDHPNYEEATNALIYLFHMLSYACGTYIFSSDDVFNSVGIGQADLFEGIVMRMKYPLLAEDRLRQLINMSTKSDLSRESLHIEFYLILLTYLESFEEKEKVIQLTKEILCEQMVKILGYGKKSAPYELRNYVDELNDLIFIFKVSMGLEIKDIREYIEYCNENNIEVVFYKMLDIIEILDKDQDWISVYEYGKKQKVKFRSSLKEQYNELNNK